MLGVRSNVGIDPLKPQSFCFSGLGIWISKGSDISLLQQPGPKKFKLSKIELKTRAKKFKVPPFAI